MTPKKSAWWERSNLNASLGSKARSDNSGEAFWFLFFLFLTKDTIMLGLITNTTHEMTPESKWEVAERESPKLTSYYEKLRGWDSNCKQRSRSMVIYNLYIDLITFISPSQTATYD